MPFDATIVIVTKNRKDELRAAIQSALEQVGRIEVLVIDDGSTDGTAEMVRAEFPAARLDRVEESRGYIVHRNRAAELASAAVLVSIDDDAAFPSPHTVEQTLCELASSRVGAVAIPSIDVHQPGKPYFRYPPRDDGRCWATESYRGTAYAVRRDLFQQLGGYREFFYHQGEEGDFCLRLLNAGYITRLGAADAIDHFESIKRDRSRIVAYDVRNRILFAWCNVPLPELLVHLPATILIALRQSLRQGYLGAALRGVGWGLAELPRQWRARRPVRRAVYHLSRRLRKQGPCMLEAIESALPPIEPPHGRTA